MGHLRPVEIRMAENFQVLGSDTYLPGKYSSLFGGPKFSGDNACVKIYTCMSLENFQISDVGSLGRGQVVDIKYNTGIHHRMLFQMEVNELSIHQLDLIMVSS